MEQKNYYERERQEYKNVANATDSNISGMRATSMSTLITWNISKVIEKNPHIDIKLALSAAQEKLDIAPHDVKEIISQFPEQRHIACALLAWKELGHNHADSLYEFFQTQRNYEQEHNSNSTRSQSRIISSHKCACATPKTTSRDINYIADCAQVKNSCKMGPVVKIPTVKNAQMEAIMSREKRPIMDARSFHIERQHTVRGPIETTVMRLDNDPCISHSQPSKKKPLDKELLRKIDEVCCLESGCVDRLAALDASTKDLRSRAAKLARREAERAELLERAEAAWKDLEQGYQRRLSLSLEKEEDITRQIQKLIQERNGYKNVCSALVNQLQQRGEAAEKIRAKLAGIEKQVCERACQRLQLSEEAARTDAVLAQQQCTAAQLDRDLQFKEEQARRRLSMMESELESSMALMNETERAMRAELGGLREQMGQVCDDLLQEDNRTARLHEEIGKYEKLKNEMSEDLEGCKEMCDRRMQSKVDDLVKKREQLEKLREVQMECRCKQPKDCTIQVKRTPSLAALCRCTPEDKFLESCSCTSLRSNLLSNLLADLFGGLQSELPENGLALPCQLLKCLEDNHNWDRPSNVKSSLRSFFSKLLVGELEIAIATSIEKYHARWVGASCADMVRRSIPDFGGVGAEGWQQRALERRAQQLAEQLAEKMFNERADTIMKQAKQIVEAGPPCACDEDVEKVEKKPHQRQAIFPLLMDVPLMPGSNKPDINKPTKDVKLTYTAQSKPIFTAKKPSSLKKDDTSTPNKSLLSPVRSSIQRPTSASCANSRASDTKALEAVATSALDNNTPECLRRAIHDVSLLRYEIDELKKMYNKKNDVTLMEKNMTDPIRRFTGPNDAENTGKRSLKAPPPSEASYSKEIKNPRSNNIENTSQVISVNKQVHFSKKKPASDRNLHAKNLPRTGMSEKHKPKPYKRPEQSYAVNLCLCGETKTSKKILRESKFSAPKELDIDKDKSTKTTIQLKPSEYSESPSVCESNCKCLNKRPSNTSIDKFLETLAKWKCDLAESDEKCKGVDEKCKGVMNNESNKLSYSLSGYDENRTKRKEKSYSAPASQMKPGNKSKSSNEIVLNKSQREAECALITTESEYMGAVNLEKSNETFCRCVIAKEMKKNSTSRLNSVINSDFPIKCLNSCMCCTKCIEKNSDEQSLLSKSRIKQNVSSLEKHQSQKSSKNIGDFKKFDSDTRRKKNINDVGHGESVAKSEQNKERKNKNQEPNNRASAIDHIVNNTDLFPCDCDYQIKFLGVTLTNENTRNVDELLCDQDQCDCSGQYTSPPDPEPMNAFVQKEYWTGLTQPAMSIPLQQQHVNENLATGIQPPSCQCNVNINDLKNFFNNAINRQNGDFIANENKNVDTCSLNDIPDCKEPCVCCYNNRKNREDALDLEANTFHLIEEHLRKKFENFKQNCTSLCLPQDVENKFYTSMMQKIKHVILESTNAVSCQCKQECDGEGSWKRAYNLLHEYLKVKIKRVQCTCVSPQAENEKMIPDVTDKVCDLIHNDFERLRDFCVCKYKLSKKISNEKQRQPFSNRADMNSNKTVTDKNVNCSPLMQTFSTQACNQNVELANKSCDAMRKPNEVVQTDQTENVMEDKCSYYSDQKEYGDDTRNYNFLSKMLEEDEFRIRISDQNEEQTTTDSAKKHLPFIGYTVDCSCTSEITDCVCSKSTVKNNPILVNDIWKSYTNRTIHDNNLDYIMDNVNKSNSLHLCFEHRQDEMKQRGNSCNIESSANCDDEIILKESDKKECSEDNTTDTYVDEALLRRQRVNSPAPDDWLDYRSPQLEGFDPCYKCVRFPHDTAAKRPKSSVAVYSTNSSTEKSCCDCEMVPVCHVKMLVQNIENKLTHSECICDTMDSKVCPIHSRRSMY